MTVQPGNLPVGYQQSPVVDAETGESQYDNAGNRLYTRTNYQVPPDGVAASGLAALAAKTEEDWMGQFAEDLLDTIDPLNALFLNIATTVMEFFSELVDLPGMLETFGDILNFFYDLLDRAGLFDFLGWLWNKFGDVVESVLKPIFDFLEWLWQGSGDFDGFGGIVDTVLKPIFEVLASIFNVLGRTVIEAITDLFDLIAGLIDIPTLQGLIEKIVNAFSGVMSAQGFVDLFTRIIEYFVKIFGGTIPDLPISLDEFIGKLPVVSTLVSIITGKTEEDGVELGLGTLGTWARDVEQAALDARSTLIKIGETLFGGTFLAPPENGTDVDLLSQGDFAAMGTIESADGWSWDSTTTASGSGGSAKLVASGSAQRLYSKQSIRVSAGDVLTVAGKVKSSGFTAASGREMVLSLVPWIGTSRVQVGGVNQNVVFTARTTNAPDWVSLGGTYTVPAGVTSVQVRLAVTANSGALVWFDDISVRRKSNLGQDYVANLIQAWRDIYFNATGTAANVLWDSVGTAIGTVKNLGDIANGAIATDRGILFGDTDGGDTVIFNALPTTELLPSSGSGAVLVRTTASPVVATTGRHPVDTGFYNVLEVTPSADIEVVSASGQYVGAFKALSKGWYLISLGFGGRRIASDGWSLAPLLYKGSSLTLGTSPTSLKPYKVGSEVWATPGAWTRYCQGTFSVFLNVGDYVKAGYDVVYGPITNTSDPVIDADTTGVENYFTIALLSKVSDTV